MGPHMQPIPPPGSRGRLQPGFPPCAGPDVLAPPITGWDSGRGQLLWAEPLLRNTRFLALPTKHGLLPRAPTHCPSPGPVLSGSSPGLSPTTPPHGCPSAGLSEPKWGKPVTPGAPSGRSVWRGSSHDPPTKAGGRWATTTCLRDNGPGSLEQTVSPSKPWGRVMCLVHQEL